MRFLAVLGAVLLAAFAAQAATYETFTLDNGLQVVIVPDHRAPVVVHSVWYRAGAMDEPTGKTGIAHMLEHLMFKGTDAVPPGEFSKTIARNGGQDYAFTNRDFTAYYQKIARDNLEIALRMEADRMANLHLNDGLFQPERKVVLEERRWRTDSKPQQRFFEQLARQWLPTHPYGNPVIGWKADIEGYTVQDAITWYNTFYAPNNAVLVMVGDVTRDKVEPLIRKYYGAVQVKKVIHPEVKPEPMQQAPQRYTQVDAEVKVPVFYRLYRAPSAFAHVADMWPDVNSSELRREALKLGVMAEILGGGATGRLYRALVEEQKIADSASADYDVAARGESSVDIFVQPKEGVTLDRIEQAVDAEIARLIKDGVTKDELERVKVSLLATDVYARDDLFNTVYRLGQWLTSGGTVDTFDAWLEDIKTVTVADVQEAARTYLVANHGTTGLLVGKQEDFGGQPPQTAAQ